MLYLCIINIKQLINMKDVIYEIIFTDNKGKELKKSIMEMYI